MMRMEDDREKGEENTSECSNGSQSQSGWTTYLDENTLDYQTVISMEEEEEDLSMISDASSGPPHFHDKDEEHYCYRRNDQCFFPCAAFNDDINGGKKKRRAAEADCSSLLLDDTASSPFFSFSKTITTSKNKKTLTQEELSCGFSATHFKALESSPHGSNISNVGYILQGKPALERHLGYQRSSDPVKSHSVCRGESERKVW